MKNHDEVRKPILFKLTKKRMNPATEGNYYPGIKRIPSEDEIYDPQTNTRRAIRYSVSETSIFKDEQSPMAILSDIIFTKGTLKVYKDNPTLLQYLRLCNWNRDNDNKIMGKTPFFYEYDQEKIRQAELDEIEKRDKAIDIVKSSSIDKLEMMSKALGLKVGRSAAEIKYDMRRFAEDYPEKVINALNSPEMARRIEVLRAGELDILHVDSRQIRLTDAKGGEKNVYTAPIGSDALDSFVKWTMNTKEGEEFYNDVIKIQKSMIG